MNKELRAEVERRLRVIRSDPERLMRYDANGDGLIDDEEWEEVRRVVMAEVQTQWRRQKEQDRSADAAEAVEPHTAELLQDRYELIRQIGRGGQGRTFRGRDLHSEQDVALKELDLRQADDWKAIELFDREARVLESLSHQAIPAYIDSFHLTDDITGEERFFLVQEFVEGTPLDQLIDGGFRMDEGQARAFIEEILQILVYLHGLTPPVIHRDIKPSNIIRRPDESLALLDFGAVQAVLPGEKGASTVVGTSGYMPLEQLMGRATPATDIYALGATTIHLLSHLHPADLPVRAMALQFAEFINVSKEFETLLEQMVAPHVEDRFSDATQVLGQLQSLDEQATDGDLSGPTQDQSDSDRPNFTVGPPQEQKLGLWGTALSRVQETTNQLADVSDSPFSGDDLTPVDDPPWGMRSTVVDGDDGLLRIDIPRMDQTKALWTWGGLTAFMVIGIALMYLAVTAGEGDACCPGCCFFLFPVAAMFPLYSRSLASHTLEVDDQGLHVLRRLPHGETHFCYEPRIPVEVSINTRTTEHNGGRTSSQHCLEIRGGGKGFKLGYHLTLEEQKYLMGQLKRALAAMGHSNGQEDEI